MAVFAQKSVLAGLTLTVLTGCQLDRPYGFRQFRADVNTVRAPALIFDRVRTDNHRPLQPPNTYPTARPIRIPSAHSHTDNSELPTTSETSSDCPEPGAQTPTTPRINSETHDAPQENNAGSQPSGTTQTPRLVPAMIVTSEYGIDPLFPAEAVPERLCQMPLPHGEPGPSFIQHQGVDGCPLCRMQSAQFPTRPASGN